MNADIISALQQLTRDDPDHLLRPRAVLAAAAPAASPLHACFEWDNRRAGEAYRLEQARTLIRTVQIANPEALERTATIMFVSLAGDRTRPGGGYRLVEEVLFAADLRAAMLATAQRELQSWMQRYRMFEALVASVAQAAQVEVPPPPQPRRAARVTQTV